MPHDSVQLKLVFAGVTYRAFHFPEMKASVKYLPVGTRRVNCGIGGTYIADPRPSTNKLVKQLGSDFTYCFDDVGHRARGTYRFGGSSGRWNVLSGSLFTSSMIFA